MAKVTLPVSMAHRHTQQMVSKRSYFFVTFVILLIMVAAMTFFGSMHLHDLNTKEARSQTMSSVIKQSEEKLAYTAEKIADVIDVTTSYIHHRLRSNLDLTTSKDSISRHVETKVPLRKRLAYVITITKDGSFQDGAAVLAYSIMKYAKNSTYDISFIAFVHPNVTTSRQGLHRLGFHVIEVPTPVNTSAIRFPFLRDHIDKNGCCGAAELIKITSYRSDTTDVHSILPLC